MDGEGGGSSFPEEQIPDGDLIYRWISPEFWKKGKPKPNPGAFGGLDEGVSVAWDKYSTPEQCRSHSNRASEMGVVKLRVGEVRRIDALMVKHKPFPKDRAHSLILGEETSFVRRELTRICSLVIPIGGREGQGEPTPSPRS